MESRGAGAFAFQVVGCAGLRGQETEGSDRKGTEAPAWDLSTHPLHFGGWGGPQMPVLP